MLRDMSKSELNEILSREREKYDAFLKEGLKMDISRGKPCKEQLDQMMPLLDILNSETEFTTDYRNYGILQGIPELRKIFADMLGVEMDNVIVGSSSSLNMMYDTIQRCMQFGICGSTPWNKLDKVKFLCPVPGYDRHFAITEHFGIEMIAVPMNEAGPDMNIVEALVASDPSIKGIWCVPKYSNPTGITYSDEVVERFAKMETAAEDFRIFWDNAYCVHDLYDDRQDSLANLMTLLIQYGNEDRVYMFTSSSKITFPGSGVACMACSQKNVKDTLSHMKFQTIGSNKIVQYGHALFLKDIDNVHELMRKHAEICRPKFDTVLASLRCGLDGMGIAKWTEPNGGYFISLDVMEGCAQRVWTLCHNAGLTITDAGSTYPLGIDDKDSNIRIAPTFASNDELDVALELLVTCVKIAAIEKLLEK